MCNNFPTVHKHRQIRPNDRLSEIASTSDGQIIPENGEAEHGVKTPGDLPEKTLVSKAFGRELKITKKVILENVQTIGKTPMKSFAAKLVFATPSIDS